MPSRPLTSEHQFSIIQLVIPQSLSTPQQRLGLGYIHPCWVVHCLPISMTAPIFSCLSKSSKCRGVRPTELQLRLRLRLQLRLWLRHDNSQIHVFGPSICCSFIWCHSLSRWHSLSHRRLLRRTGVSKYRYWVYSSLDHWSDLIFLLFSSHVNVRFLMWVARGTAAHLVRTKGSTQRERPTTRCDDEHKRPA